MLLDVQNMFSDAQAVTAAAASTNTIDLGAPGQSWHGQTVEQDVGKGGERCILIHIPTAFAGGGFTGLNIAVEVDDNEGFGSPKVIDLGTIAVADLAAGRSFRRYVPIGTDERYMRLQYTPQGASASAGAISAGIVSSFQDNNVAA